MSAAEATGSSDIDPIWAEDGSHLPDWFVDALAVPREEGFVTVEGAQIPVSYTHLRAHET